MINLYLVLGMLLPPMIHVGDCSSAAWNCAAARVNAEPVAWSAQHGMVATWRKSSPSPMPNSPPSMQVAATNLPLAMHVEGEACILHVMKSSASQVTQTVSYVGYTRALGRLCAGASVLCKYSCIVFTLYLRVFTAPLFSRYVYFVNHSQGWERVVWARFAVIYNIL